ncbi:zinc finger SWIM domain-containing protein 1 [Xenopus tropicalis]|eukprot:NP_001004917.1 zinc finger SWIM domain-containing protein 1 [Xenopus tropicalis]
MLKIQLKSLENVSPAKNKVFQSLQNVMINDPGSQLSFQLDTHTNIESINFQSSFMTRVFNESPKALLMIRINNTKGKTLYLFAADGPCMRMEYDFLKLVHLAIPKEETPKGLTDMFTLLKDFNSRWADISTFLVDPLFKGKYIISKIFPSAEVVLSAYHVSKHIQEEIYSLSLPQKSEKLLTEALKKTMCSATDTNLKKMHMTLLQILKPDQEAAMNPDLLLEDKIWALHRWRTPPQCSVYFHTVEVARKEFSNIFDKPVALETVVTDIIKFIQDKAHKWQVEKLTCSPDDTSLLCSGKCPKKESYGPMSSDFCLKSGTESDSSVKPKEESNLEPERQTEAGELICQSLDRVCIAAASDLCMKELCAAQKSAQLLLNKTDNMVIQLLENPQEVTWESPKQCTCYFNKCLKLPCRHILAVLNANKEVLKPEMFDSAWHKQTNGYENILPVPIPTLEIIKGESKGIADKHMQVETLMNQMAQSLADCSNEVFQHRYSMLRELADSWIGPYEQVEL